MGFSGKLTSICNPCDNGTIAMCSIGCADSVFLNRSETIYDHGADIGKIDRFETNFDRCHPFWKKATIDIVPVTHSTSSTRAVKAICTIAAIANLLILIFGYYQITKKLFPRMSLFSTEKMVL